MDHCEYRKNKRDNWVVCGPTSLVKPDATVTVHLRSGKTKQETISKVGRAFERDGVQCVYGYLAPKGARAAAPASNEVADLKAQLAHLTAIVAQFASPQLADAAE